MSNPYTILGLNKDASKEEIKEAYKKLAKLHHPDKGGNEEMFKLIKSAYELLINEESINHFDETGEVLKNDFTQRFNNFIEKVVVPSIHQILNVGTVDVIKHIGNAVKQVSTELQIAYKGIEENKTKLSEVLSRLQSKSVSDQLLTESLENVLQKDEYRLKSIQSDLKFLDKCLEIIKGYGYKVDSVQKINFINESNKIKDWLNESVKTKK